MTLVLADYHVVFSEGLGMLLDAEDDLVVLGLAHHSRHAVDAIARYRPAVCILDAQLPTATWPSHGFWVGESRCGPRA